jgi:hypothetical protein
MKELFAVALAPFKSGPLQDKEMVADLFCMMTAPVVTWM